MRRLFRKFGTQLKAYLCVWDITLSSINLSTEAEGEDILSPSPAFEIIEDDVTRFLIEQTSTQENIIMDNEDEMEVDPVSLSRKRIYISTEEEEVGNNNNRNASTNENTSKTSKANKISKKKITLKDVNCADFSDVNNKSKETYPQPSNKVSNQFQRDNAKGVVHHFIDTNTTNTF